MTRHSSCHGARAHIARPLLTTRRTGRRIGGDATGCLVTVLLLTATPPDRLSAQLSLQPSFGIRYTSTLVHDAIVAPLDVRPAIAPVLALAAAAPLQGKWSAEATADVSWSTVERHEQGATVELGTLTALALQLGVRRQLASRLSGRVSIGALKYFASDRIGMFREGTGVFPLGGAALSYGLPLSFALRWGVGLEARYDLHQFITAALRAQGFTSSRTVHRVAIGVRFGLRAGRGAGTR